MTELQNFKHDSLQPKSNELISSLKSTFEQSLISKGVQPKVVSVNLCFDTSDYLRLRSLVDSCKHKLSKLNFEQELGHEAPVDPDLQTVELNKLLDEVVKTNIQEDTPLLAQSSDIRRKIQKLEELVSETEIQMKALEYSFSLGSASPHFLGSAYITFERMSDKEQIYHTYVARERFFSRIVSKVSRQSTQLLKLKIPGSQAKHCVLVDCAAGPADIAWANLGINFRSKHYRQSLNMLLIVIVMIANFFIIYKSKNLLARILSAKSGDRQGLKYNSVLVTFVGNTVMAMSTLILNTILGKLITYMIDFNGLPSETNFTLTKVKLIWRSQFVMKAIIPAVAASLVLDIYGQNGYIYTVFSNIIKYALVVPIMARIFNVDVWAASYERSQVETFIKNVKDGSKFTVKEACKKWVDDVFFASSLLTKYLRSLATVVFVAPVFPIVSLMYPVLGIQTHYSYKFALLRQSKKGPAFADKILAETVDEMFLCVICFILGCVFRDFSFGLNEFARFSIRPIHVMLLLLMIVLMTLKTRKLVKLSIPHIDKSNAPKFSELLKRSLPTYAFCNPAYSAWIKGLPHQKK